MLSDEQLQRKQQLLQIGNEFLPMEKMIKIISPLQLAIQDSF